MTIPYQTIIKICLFLKSLAEESPLNKYSKNEFNLALYNLSLVSSEKNIREGLNKCLVHLESAFVNYHPSTWDIWDRDRVLWDKITFKNSICLLIAIINYLLDNKITARRWLIDNLDDMGHIFFPTELLSELSIPSEMEFYRLLNCENAIASLKGTIEWNYRCTYGLDDPDPSGFDYLP